MTAIAKGIIWAATIEPVMQMLGLGSIFAAWKIAKKSETYDNYFIRSEEKSTKNNLEDKT